MARRRGDVGNDGRKRAGINDKIHALEAARENAAEQFLTTDQGLRINDDQHQWGTRFRSIAADPRIFGRVYVGTDGRGIFYGTPSGEDAHAR